MRQRKVVVFIKRVSGSLQAQSVQLLEIVELGLVVTLKS